MVDSKRFKSFLIPGRQAFWKEMPAKSFIIISISIFCLFASIGFVNDLFSYASLPAKQLFWSVVYSGLVAVGWVYAFTRRMIVLPLVILFQVAFLFLPWRSGIEPVVDSAIKQRLILDGLGILISIMLGYIFMIIFISREGMKYLKVKTEMDLAQKMHEVLVPQIQIENKRFEIYGKSLPASAVGGDIIDCYQGQNNLTCYVADIAGHGVASGLMMAMFKSAIHSNLQKNLSLKDTLNETNNTITPIKKKNMFLTCACLRFTNESDAEFSIAGHLPILYYDSNLKTFRELLIKQIPLAAQTQYEFETERVSFKKGDCFILLTDGIIETVNKQNQEYGLERFKDLLLQQMQFDLKKVFDLMIKALKQYGTPRDDVSMLIIRCL